MLLETLVSKLTPNDVWGAWPTLTSFTSKLPSVVVWTCVTASVISNLYGVVPE